MNIENMNTPKMLALGEAHVTMTTLAQKVYIYLGGSGTATIDWGDGLKVRTINLVPVGDEKHPTSLIRVFKRYSDTSAHTITITGSGITFVGCNGSNLTALDVSQNPALTRLDCRNNQLTELDVSQNAALTQLKCYKN